jgi:hypothetical protein
MMYEGYPFDLVDWVLILVIDILYKLLGKSMNWLQQLRRNIPMRAK